MGPLGCCERILISFLFEFSGAVVVPVITVVVIPLLEFLITLAAIVGKILTIPVPALIGPEALHVRRIGEFQLTIGKVGKLALDSVVVNGLLMPVVISQLHVVGDCIGETVAFFRVLFGQSLVDDYLQVFSKVRELGITFGIFQRFWTCAQRFPGGNGIRRGDFQLEIGDQE